MIKLIWFVLFLLHRYYKTGRYSNIAYSSSIFAFMAILFFNILSIFKLLNLDINYIMPFNLSDEKWTQYLKVAVSVTIPGSLLLSFFFKKEKLLKLEYDKDKIEIGNGLLVLYVIVSFIAFIILSIK